MHVSHPVLAMRNLIDIAHWGGMLDGLVLATVSCARFLLLDVHAMYSDLAHPLEVGGRFDCRVVFSSVLA